MSVEAKLKTLIAAEEIRQLMAKYCHGIDKKDEATFMSIWADNAEYKLPRGSASNIDEVRELVRKVWTQVPRCHHHITNPIISVDGESATAATDVFYFRLTADGLHTLLSGSYEFRFAEVDDEWKVTFLEFSPFVDTSPVFAENVR